MKSSGLKFEYILLGIVILSLVLYLFLRNPDKIQYSIPEIDSISVEDVSKLELIKADETITLEKKDEEWLIVPQGYPADKEKVNKMAKEISELTLTDVISESKSGYSKYGLDQKEGIRARAYGQKEVIREFTIGKQAPTYRHTFVRILDDTRVFQARNSFRSQFEQTVDNLRNKTVMKFDPAEIREIELKQGKESLLFSKQMEKVEIKAQPNDTEGKQSTEKSPQPQEVEIWVTPDGTRAKTETMKSLITDLSNLRCLKFEEDKMKSDLTNPVYSIVLKGNESYTLNLFPKNKEADDSYPAITSVSAYPFFLSSYKAESLMKKPEDILQK
jgi:hypothetical protein